MNITLEGPYRLDDKTGALYMDDSNEYPGYGESIRRYFIVNDYETGEKKLIAVPLSFVRNLNRVLVGKGFRSEDRADERKTKRLENSIEILSKRIKELEEKESKTSPI